MSLWLFVHLMVVKSLWYRIRILRFVSSTFKNYTYPTLYPLKILRYECVFYNTFAYLNSVRILRLLIEQKLLIKKKKNLNEQKRHTIRIPIWKHTSLVKWCISKKILQDTSNKHLSLIFIKRLLKSLTLPVFVSPFKSLLLLPEKRFEKTVLFLMLHEL